MHFRETNMEPSMYFRKANIEFLLVFASLTHNYTPNFTSNFISVFTPSFNLNLTYNLLHHDKGSVICVSYIVFFSAAK